MRIYPNAWNSIDTVMVAASDATAAEKSKALASGGYVCDGTADNIQIQAVIDACSGTRMQRILLVGNFVIAASVVGESYTILELDGSVQLAANSNVDLLDYTSKSNFEIIGGIWDGNKANQGDVGYWGINLQSCSYFTVRDVTVHDIDKKTAAPATGGYGIYLAGCTYGKVEDCLVYECGNPDASASNGVGIMLCGTSNYNTVSNCCVHDCDGGIYMYVASGDTVDKNIISNNLIYDIQRDGIICYCDAAGTVGLNTITHNTVVDAGLNGGNPCITIGNNGASNSNIVSNNHVINVAIAGYGIQVWGSYNIVTGNIATNIRKEPLGLVESGGSNIISNNAVNGIQHSGYAAIRVHTSSNNIINGNSLNAVGGEGGILLDGTSTNNTISYNDIAVDSTDYWVKFLAAADTGNIVSNNFFQSGGVVSDAGTLNTFNNNTNYTGETRIQLLPALTTDHHYNGFTRSCTCSTTAHIAIGNVCYMNSSGTWDQARGNAYATTAGQLVIATSAADHDGTTTFTGLLYGYFIDATQDYTIGGEVWISAATAGLMTKTQPTTPAFLRCVGYGDDDTDTIFFNPCGAVVEI